MAPKATLRRRAARRLYGELRRIQIDDFGHRAGARKAVLASRPPRLRHLNAVGRQIVEPLEQPVASGR